MTSKQSANMRKGGGDAGLEGGSSIWPSSSKTPVVSYTVTLFLFISKRTSVFNVALPSIKN